MYKTYIFDLDGTLLNTLNDLASSTNYALQQMGMPERSIDEVRQFVGNGVRVLIEKAVPKETPMDVTEQVLDIFRKHYLEHGLDTTQPYPGVTDMLRRLKENGCNLAVVSNKFYAATQELCRAFFPDTIEIAIGEREDIRRKPAPDTVEEALRQLGVGKEGAVYVGDSEVDLMTARNSGLPCISVLWGFRERSFLESNGATMYAKTPQELIDSF